MSQVAKYLSEGITRRSFLKKSLGLGVIILAAEGAGTILFTACSKPKTADMSVTSSVDNNHSHIIAIPGADVDSAPASKTYKSDGASHQHEITLTKANFEAIRSGQEVSVVSTSTGTTPHTHTWKIKKA